MNIKPKDYKWTITWHSSLPEVTEVLERAYIPLIVDMI